MLKRILLLAIFLLFAFASTLLAAVPALMNYQGILTNASGNPLISTSRTVKFHIYDDPNAGAIQWAETLTVNTDASGRFNTILGQVHPLTDAVFSGTDRYLGLTVASDPELSPRTQIVSVGYANRVSTVDGATGGTITGDVTLQSTLTADNVVAGDATTAGTVLAQNGNGTTGATVSGSGAGGSILVQDEASAYTHYLAPGFYGDGGSIVAYGDQTFTSGVEIDGDGNGSDDPWLFMLGSSQIAQINLGNTGDASVSFPDSAISSGEMLNEPGITADHVIGFTDLVSAAAMVDLVTTTITIPAAGYIVVRGWCYLVAFGTTSTNDAIVQIDETAGGSITVPYFTAGGEEEHGSSTAVYFEPMSVERIFSKAAGTWTFRLEAQTNGTTGAGGTTRIGYPHITATYFPTSYGSVTTFVSQNEATQFEKSIQVEPVGVTGTDAPQVTELIYQVDLRELELKAAKARAESEKAQRELLQAQMKLQQEKIQALKPKLERK